MCPNASLLRKYLPNGRYFKLCYLSTEKVHNSRRDVENAVGSVLACNG